MLWFWRIRHLVEFGLHTPIVPSCKMDPRLVKGTLKCRVEAATDTFGPPLAVVLGALEIRRTVPIDAEDPERLLPARIRGLGELAL